MLRKISWNSHPAIAAAAIAGVFFLFGLAAIDDFGVTWDEPLHFAGGDLYLNRILNPDIPIIFLDKYFEEDIKYYGPIFDIWGALNHRIFTVGLGLLEEDNARHLHLLLSGSLTIFLTVLLAWRSISPRVGLLSGLFLAGFPRFVGHTFNNPKDIPLVLVFVLCLYIFQRRLFTGKRFYSIFLILAGGVGFATRIQYLIVLPLITVLTIVYYYIINQKMRQFKVRWTSYWDIPVSLLLAVPMGILFWPYFWNAPLEKLPALLDFYLSHQVQAKLLILYLGEDYIPGLNLPWHYAPVMLAVTTPIIILGAMVTGWGTIIAAIFRKHPVKEKFAGYLYLLWVICGLLPFMLPGQRVYGGIRHFLFVVPALCITAGIGLDFLLFRFRGRLRYAARIAVALLFILLFTSTYSYHPYYTIYYNALVGGPRGAFGRFSVENWGNAYKAACRWINLEAPQGAVVLALVAEGIPRWYLRPDITVLPPQAAADPFIRYDYSIYILRDIDPLLPPAREPVFQIAVKGQPICNVHRW